MEGTMFMSAFLRPTAKRRATGFTLMESLMAMAVASIVVTAAVPAMQDFIIRNRMTTEVNAFVASLHLARSEAVKRMQNVRLCPTTTDSTGKITGCTGIQQWQVGWMVYADMDNSDTFSSGDVILQQNPALPNRYQINGNQSRVIYDATGKTTSDSGGVSNGTFLFCDSGGIAQGRKVVVSREGRVRVDHLASGACAPPT
jgi:type IV fimbrial biogenesis protein FimT